MGYFFNFDKLSYLRERKCDGCILCHVAAGDGEAVDLSAFKDSLFTISLNLYPYNPGHVLIFPNRHVLDLRELTQEERLRLDALIDATLDALDETQRPSAYNIGFNIGPDAGASIPHLHLHVIPRYPHEIGIAELVGGARVLVQDPRATRAALAEALARRLA
jgi:ATP adenylyltransferase